jgi:hypothetical protein
MSGYAVPLTDCPDQITLELASAVSKSLKTTPVFTSEGPNSSRYGVYNFLISAPAFKAGEQKILEAANTLGWKVAKISEISFDNLSFNKKNTIVSFYLKGRR